MESSQKKRLQESQCRPEKWIKDISSLCTENNIDVPTLLQILLKSTTQRCPFNWLDDAEYGVCSDVRGENLAVELKDLTVAWNQDNIRCKEIVSKGYCAEINKTLFNLEIGLREYLAEQSNTR